MVITEVDICDELKVRLAEIERMEQFTSLDRLIPCLRNTLGRLDAIRWGDRLKDGESTDELALGLAVDAIRLVNEFRENNPVDPNW